MKVSLTKVIWAMAVVVGLSVLLRLIVGPLAVSPPPSSQEPVAIAASTVSISPPVVLSPDVQRRAGLACNLRVGEGGALEAHRKGKTGLSPDRVLLHGWGGTSVKADETTGLYRVTSSVDTLTGYSGNIVRTPFECVVRWDFVVASVEFLEIQFPRR